MTNNEAVRCKDCGRPKAKAADEVGVNYCRKWLPKLRDGQLAGATARCLMEASHAKAKAVPAEGQRVEEPSNAELSALASQYGLRKIYSQGYWAGYNDGPASIAEGMVAVKWKSLDTVCRALKYYGGKRMVKDTSDALHDAESALSVDSGRDRA